MFLLLLLVANTAAPTAADVQAVEEARVFEPLIDQTRDGRAFVEFAPTAETRNAACAPISAEIYECRFEARVKDAFAQEFGAWVPRRARLTWHGDCWRQDNSDNGAAP